MRPKKEVLVKSDLISDEMLEAQVDPAGYRLLGTDSERVTRAINAALLLRLPLLISGEPGSGKTQLGFAVAHELGKPKAFKFSVKSTSSARDLFYRYDAIGHFRAAQIAAAGAAAAAPAAAQPVSADARDYIEYSALGLAILLALPLASRMRFLGPGLFNSPDSGDDEGSRLRALLRQDAPQQTVVIVDEVDKAPRDFPNDLLHEIETMSFRVPELGGLETPVISPANRPIVFVTSNSERQLPEAFLRRCAFVRLNYPQGEALETILWSRLSLMYRKGSPLVKDVCAFYEDLRSQETFDKPPGTAELIQFLQAARIYAADPEKTIAEQCETLIRAAPMLAKAEDDTARLILALRGWTGAPG